MGSVTRFSVSEHKSLCPFSKLTGLLNIIFYITINIVLFTALKQKIIINLHDITRITLKKLPNTFLYLKYN